jgi:UDP-N-acetylmuramoylalanine--D-glutamate ligase
VIRTLDGVTYVDDSKATNPHAASAAIAGFPAGSVVWVLGGLAKGADLHGLVSERADRLRAAVVIGVDQAAYVDALAAKAPGVPVVVVEPSPKESVMARAVAEARKVAQAGDTVQLAPAGASMDQFKSYSHRGDAFAEAVGALSS